MKLTPRSKAGQIIDDLSVYVGIIGEVILFCCLVALFISTCILVVQ